MNGYILDKKIVLFWTPKCGCTSISYLMNNFKKDYSLDIKNVVFDQDKLNECKELRKIIVMRNPYHRIASAYINKFVYHVDNGYLNSFDKLEHFAKDLILSENQKFFKNDRFVGISFNEFVLLVNKHFRKDFHWNRQIQLDIKFDCIVHLEKFETELKNAFKSLDFNYDFELPHINKSGFAPKKKSDISNIKNYEMEKYKDLLGIENLLNPINKKTIFSIYQRDFEVGGY